MKRNLALLIAMFIFAAILLPWPFINRIHPMILGLPFIYFYLFLFTILTPIATFIIYKLQGHKPDDEE